MHREQKKRRLRTRNFLIESFQHTVFICSTEYICQHFRKLLARNTEINLSISKIFSKILLSKCSSGQMKRSFQDHDKKCLLRLQKVLQKAVFTNSVKLSLSSFKNSLRNLLKNYTFMHFIKTVSF